MRESDADNFAKNILIPNDDFYKFVNNKDFKEVTLKKFAKAEGMAVRILVGRLQKEGYLEFYQFDDLKTQYNITTGNF